MFVLVVMAGLGSAGAATFGPPAAAVEAEPRLGLPEPAALGSPCLGNRLMADRRPIVFSLDLFSMGPPGTSRMAPPGYDDGVLGLLCRLATFPIGSN